MRNDGGNRMLVLFLALCGLPLLAGLIYGLLYSFGLAGSISEGFTIEHWSWLFSDFTFWKSLLYSAYIAALSMGISILLALGLTLGFGDLRRFPLMRGMLFIPLAFPPVVMAFLAFQWFSQAGVWARLAHSFGFIKGPEEFPGIIQEPGGLAIVLAHVAMATPFLALLFSGIYRNERMEELRGAAYTLGASKRRFAQKVLLPLTLRRARPNLLLYSVFVFGAYETPLLLGSERWRMTSIVVVDYFRGFDLLRIPKAFAMAIVVAIISGLAAFTLEKLRRT